MSSANPRRSRAWIIKLLVASALLLFWNTVVPGTGLLRSNASYSARSESALRIEEVFHPPKRDQPPPRAIGVNASPCANCLPAIVVFSLVRDDLLASFLSSIDVVTEQVFVVCNYLDHNLRDNLLRTVVKFSNCSTPETTRCLNPNIRQLRILSSDENVGFAGSFNLALKCLLDNQIPYALFNNDDVTFLPGRLLAAKRILETTNACMYYFEGFSSFAISFQGILLLGSMDENFWPAYGEDCDYWYRSQLQKCKNFHRGGFVPDHSTGKGRHNAFVVHGDGKYTSSTTYKSSSTVAKLVTNTLDSQRGRFAYLRKKWGFNTCELYHEVINSPRTADELIIAVNTSNIGSTRYTRPYGTLMDINSWAREDWRQEGSISPRGINSKWAPEQTVWCKEDDDRIKAIKAAVADNKTN